MVKITSEWLMGLELYGAPRKLFGGQILRIDISSNMSEMSEGAFQVFAQCILLSSGDSFHLISFRKKIWYWWLNGDFPSGLHNFSPSNQFLCEEILQCNDCECCPHGLSCHHVNFMIWVAKLPRFVFVYCLQFLMIGTSFLHQRIISIVNVWVSHCL